MYRADFDPANPQAPRRNVGGRAVRGHCCRRELQIVAPLVRNLATVLGARPQAPPGTQFLLVLFSVMGSGNM
jgi:hypothetical protein